jgi:hypothetical protein
MANPAQYTKDPNAVLDYSEDWTDWLAGDTISALSITATAGITVQSQTVTFPCSIVWVWLAGGTASYSYDIVFHITTTAGRQDDRTITINCLSR